NIFVFRQQPDGTYAAPRSFAVGTNPVGITVQDLNNDGIMDVVVANRGSNDVSVLFGSGTKLADGSIANWTLTPGPRLKAGNGPLGVTLQDQNGDTIPDMFVTDSDGTIRVLPGIGTNGVGSGFFDDTNIQRINVGSSIIQAMDNNFVPTTNGIFEINPTLL